MKTKKKRGVSCDSEKLERKNPAKNMYGKAMIPAFTNLDRKVEYIYEENGGFSTVNKDVEEELFQYQESLEEKFAKS
jgi:hypothetical protein